MSKLREKNCSIISIEREDYYDEKSKKKKRKTIQTKECDLVSVKSEGIKPVKKLTKHMLKEMIKEVIQEEKDRYKTKYREDIFPGWEDFQSISRGIFEEEIEEEDLQQEKCGDNIKGNRRHDISGRFTSKDDNTSWSLQNRGCGASKMSPGSNVRRATKLPCGRSARKKGKNIRCRDGAVLPLEERDQESEATE